MESCALCGSFGNGLQELPYRDRDGKKIVACDRCVDKMMGRVAWCDKHRCYHEAISWSGGYFEACLPCWAEEKRSAQ